MTTIYVTKWCLTCGIEKVEAEKSKSNDTWYAYGNGRVKTHVFAGDYYLNEQDAMQRARLMRDRKLNSLKKQITKLEAMDFGGAK